MESEDTHKLVAALAVHRLLIRELLALTFGQQRDAARKFDDFATRIMARLEVATVPQLDPALSDLMAQESADAMRSILEEARKVLVTNLNQQPPQTPR
jgi:hypothetical protein